MVTIIKSKVGNTLKRYYKHLLQIQKKKKRNLEEKVLD